MVSDTESEAEEEDETGFHLVDRIVSTEVPQELDRMRFRVRWLNCTPRKILEDHLKTYATTCSFRHMQQEESSHRFLEHALIYRSCNL
jgi:hypothetical protein